MISLQNLEEMDDARFAAWLRSRLRGATADPPYNRDHESQHTFVVHASRTGSEALKRRIESGLIGEIQDAVAKDALTNEENEGVWSAAAAILRLQLNEAIDPLFGLLRKHGHIPPGSSALTSQAERSVMRTILTLGAPDEMRWVWYTLWQDEARPDFWDIATWGLRKADPMAALDILPLAAHRSRRDPNWPVENILMALWEEPSIPKAKLKASLADSPEDFQTFRKALSRFGEEWASRILYPRLLARAQRATPGRGFLEHVAGEACKPMVAA
ncbi:MAG: hypothetical protein ACKVVT_11110 [Dehalococcoidia bacterium]